MLYDKEDIIKFSKLFTTGNKLDRLGTLYGIERKPEETDDKLVIRLKCVGAL